MKQLTTQQRVQVVAALVEGNSINSTVRMTGVSKPTILRLIGLLGDACQKFHDEKVRNLSSKRVECDEVWSFCHAKAKNVPAEYQGKLGYGDVWTFTAPQARYRHLRGALQLLPESHENQEDPGHGGWSVRSQVVNRRIDRTHRHI